jgi:hypothetical protein
VSNINLHIFTPGAVVYHHIHGNGRVVVSAEDGQSVVRFEGKPDFTTVQTAELLLSWKPLHPKWLKSLREYPLGPRSFSACNFYQRNIEDWNCDRSLNPETHDMVAGERRTDLEAVERADYEWEQPAQATGDDPDDSGEGLPADLPEPEPELTVTMPVNEAGDITVTRSADAITLHIPLTPLRELKQRTSKRQRKLLRAFELWRKVKDWDEVARLTGESRETVRGYRAQIKALLGESPLVADR